MKKLIVITLLAALLCSCSHAEPSVTEESAQTDPPLSAQTETEYAEQTSAPASEAAQSTVEQTNPPETTLDKTTQAPEPIPETVGFYILEGGRRTLVNSVYTAYPVAGVDIACFELFPTREQIIGGGNYARLWDKYDDELPEKYKIGYSIAFEAEGELYNADITSPDDTMLFSEYFEIYIYDDIHQEPGARYSHLTKLNDDTLITSIKLTAAEKIGSVSSITLRAYLYDDTGSFSETIITITKGTDLERSHRD